MDWYLFIVIMGTIVLFGECFLSINNQNLYDFIIRVTVGVLCISVLIVNWNNHWSDIFLLVLWIIHLIITLIIYIKRENFKKE